MENSSIKINDVLSEQIGLQQFEKKVKETDNLIGLYKETLKKAIACQEQQFLGNKPIHELVTELAAVIDVLLVNAWYKMIGDNDNLSLIAVGGYGRGELHPRSDVDILILLQDSDQQCQEAIESYITFVWDIGLDIGHSVRTLDECVEQAALDITIATNLMESRILAGPSALFEVMKELTGKSNVWQGSSFFEAKCKEQKIRYEKFDDAVYNLEPNIKEGPGGLRDIQMIGWVAKRHFGVTTMFDLVTKGFLTEQEYQSLMEGQYFLWRIRFVLHITNKRREDRLLFDHQKNIAEILGYQGQDYKLAVEELMQVYYRTIKQNSRLNELLLQLFSEAIIYPNSQEKPIPLNSRFQKINNYIEVTSDDVFKRYPFALLELFLLMQVHPELTGVRAETIRLIRNHKYLIDDHFRNDIRVRSLFMEIMRQPRGITHEVRRMHRYGILEAYLPVFSKIVGQMQYDLFHAYTVDEHMIFVLRNLRRLATTKFAKELPFCSELMQRLPKQEVIYITALFHDIAKGRQADHSIEGAIEADKFCKHHHMSRYDTHMVCWLVRHHLVMSLTAQRKDISDPDVVKEFAKLVGDQYHLDYLYLLTVSDIRATNTNLWNSWKDSLLRELYHATKRMFLHGLENPIGLEELIQETQESAVLMLQKKQIDLDQVRRFWHNLPQDYFQRYSAEEIVFHVETILDQGDEKLPLIKVRQHPKSGSTEVFIYTQDADILFSLSTSILDKMGLTVLDARILTTNDGYALNSFLVLEESGDAIKDSIRDAEILDTLLKYHQYPLSPPVNVNRRIPRQVKHFKTPTEIQLHDDEKNQTTTVELYTTDRPGLLSVVGRAFNACNIQIRNARIATIGSRAEDVFVITNNDGQPLTDPKEIECLEQTIYDYLSDFQ